MVVDSIIDVYGISMGFYTYNVLWDIFVLVGLVYIPIIAFITKEVSECLKSSMTDANTRTALRTVGIGMLSIIVVLNIALYPIVPLAFDDVRYYARQCTSDTDQGGNITKSIAGEEGQFVANQMEAQLGGRKIGVPLLFYATFKLGYGVKNWAVSELPCNTDIRLISQSVMNQAIKDPSLLRETNEFIRMCFNRAKNKYLAKEGVSLSDEENWPGNSLFVTTKGYYDNADGDGFYSRLALNGFGDTTNKLPESESLEEGYGFPTCKEWWLGTGVVNKPYSSGTALSTRLYDHLDDWLQSENETIYTVVTNRLNRVKNANYQYLAIKDAVIRESFFSPIKLTQLSSKSTTDYGLQGDSSVTDYFFRAAGTLGVVAKSPEYFAGGSMLQLSMPMVKPFILMAIVISIVPALVFSGYKWKHIGLLCGVIGSILFWPFFWELARLIDDTFLTAVGVPITEVNTQVISQLIISGLYLYLPIMFSLVLTWVGAVGADGVMSKMASSAGGSAGQGGIGKMKSIGNAGKGAITKGMK
ncbi:conjugal transfer protein TraG N-terminal domain-containing protein [Vibrio fluvialis]|uniref:conjugal transfer protein TraG N-terminal domain-containing protein n=1 Tax=Vibrio fluvialis TaxID=676 RepID=UPI00192ACB6E|nr:conjugal transfer protein TraG N-terminal domain-containing protein [Vibrio fluvialis]MBL4262798.1 conjugal transfer protein TraG N-terminal domain-containing protein [Vibrio fluvialis]MBY8168135.1 conjugal transfer protein TraG N-terminal domain-containing protein [Vibrio fluvialis]